MENIIKINHDGTCSMSVTTSAWKRLESFVPKGCPFAGYTTADLLRDFVSGQGWKIRHNSMKIVDFIRLLQKENYIYAVVYGNAIINLIEE